MGQSASNPRPEDKRVGPVKNFDDFHIQRIRGHARSGLSCFTGNSWTIAIRGDGDSTTRTVVCNIAVPPHDAHTEVITENGEKRWKQRFRSLQTTVPDVRNRKKARDYSCKS